jgi:hypothetical protein
VNSFTMLSILRNSWIFKLKQGDMTHTDKQTKY